MVGMIGLYAGSFDPVHLGHLDIIEAASQQCSQVYVAVLRNPTKGSGLIPLEDRNDVVRRCVRVFTTCSWSHMKGCSYG